jgi:hypothetical protein
MWPSDLDVQAERSHELQAECLIPVHPRHIDSLLRATGSAIEFTATTTLIDLGHGVQATRNELWRRSRLPYISYLDADDERIVGSLGTQFKVMQRTQADCVYGSNQHFPVKLDPVMAIASSQINAAILWKRSALETIEQVFGYLWPLDYKACTCDILLLRALQCELKVVGIPEQVINHHGQANLIASNSNSKVWGEHKLRLLNELADYVQDKQYDSLINRQRAIANRYAT